jgi:opacity protein-like surface antigen
MKFPVIVASLAVTLIATVPATSQAQTFVTPFVGATFGADSPGEKLTYGASALFMGRFAGFEVDFGYTPAFFDDSDLLDLVDDSNVTALSANLVLGVGDGPVRPYVTGGVGMLRSRITSAEQFFDDVSQNDLGVNAGAGVILMFSERVGVRGDARYFRSLQEIDAGDLSVSLGNFDFWRGYAGLTFKF